MNNRKPALLGRAFLLVMILAVISGCTWVKLNEAGKGVRLVNIGEAAGCERLGEATAHVLDKVGFIKRSREKQAGELATLARNEAGDMGGNTIVAISDIKDGSRTFAVYRCK